MPVLGSGSIRFRRAVPLFKKVDVIAHMIDVDEKWIYLEHKVVSGDTVYYVAILKAAFLNTDGRIPVSELLNI